MKKEVIIYSTPFCHFCQMAKEFFVENNIEYIEYDVSQDLNKREEMIQKSGQMGVPVIIVDGEIIVGFDEKKLKKVFNL